MIFNKKIICIIPAKKKSSGLKMKNFKKVNGHPLYIHSINLARKLRYVDKIVVSSDSNEIIRKSNSKKVSTIKRPTKLASNSALIKDVIIHVLKKVKENFDILILLQPTTPIISIKELESALKILVKKNYSSVISIKEGKVTIPHLLKKNKNGIVNHITNKKIISSNRQDFSKYFLPSGDFFICKISQFLKKKSFYMKKSFGFITKNQFSVDINFKDDLDYLNFLLRK